MSNKLRILSLVLLIPMYILLFTPKQDTLAENFQDINEGHKYFLAINYLRENGIIQGYEDNTFKPDEKINRAEALKMLTLASGIFTQEQFSPSENLDEETSVKEAPFSDTPVYAWYTKYLAAAKEKGIINGYSDGSFKPDKTINLAETLKIYFESIGNLDYSKTTENLVKDTPLESWFSQYAGYATSLGLINIYSDNTVKPDQEMTRGYMAEIIYRTQLSSEGYKFGKATWYYGIAEGDNLTTAHKTLPKGTILEVSNLSNGKTVQVKVNDRGPYGPGRELDLSSKAFSEIADLGTGVIYIQYKIISTPS